MDGIGAPGPGSVPTYLYLFSDVTPETPKYRAIQWLAARGFWPCPEPNPRNARTVLESAAFKPHDPVTAAELARIATIFMSRAGPPKRPIVVMGPLLTRITAADWFVSYLGLRTPPGRDSYADVPPRHPLHDAVEALKDSGIDSRLWDYERAFASEGRLYFRPNEPITRAQFAELLYLAHMHLGPLWEDHPVDRSPIPTTR